MRTVHAPHENSPIRHNNYRSTPSSLLARAAPWRWYHKLDCDDQEVIRQELGARRIREAGR